MFFLEVPDLLSSAGGEGKLCTPMIVVSCDVYDGLRICNGELVSSKSCTGTGLVKEIRRERSGIYRKRLVTKVKQRNGGWETGGLCHQAGYITTDYMYAKDIYGETPIMGENGVMLGQMTRKVEEGAWAD